MEVDAGSPSPAELYAMQVKLASVSRFTESILRTAWLSSGRRCSPRIHLKTIISGRPGSSTEQVIVKLCFLITRRGLYDIEAGPGLSGRELRNHITLAVSKNRFGRKLIFR